MFSCRDKNGYPEPPPTLRENYLASKRRLGPLRRRVNNISRIQSFGGNGDDNRGLHTAEDLCGTVIHLLSVEDLSVF